MAAKASTKAAATTKRRAPTPKREETDDTLASTGERAPGRGKYDRTRTQDERVRDQRRRLLDAAGHVFAEVGWADATVEAIVTRAGMSRRTFYEHFDDLKSCLLTLNQRVSDLSFRTVEALVQNETEPSAMLRVGITSFLGGIATYPHMARVIFRVTRSAGPEFEAVQERTIARFARLVEEGVNRAHQRGTLGRPADDLRIFAVTAAVEAVAMRYVVRGEESKVLDAAPILIDMITKTFS